MKLGLLGLGSFGGHAFAELFTYHPSVDGVILCDAEPSKLKFWMERLERSGKLDKAHCTTSFDDLLRTDADAIIIITQPSLHAAQAVKAMQAGKHVYSAVPVVCLPDFDETLDWCQQIKDAEKATGCRYMLGETTIYRPQTRFCMKKAAEGAFGQYVYSTGHYTHDVDWDCCSLRGVHKSRYQGIIGDQLTAFDQSYFDRGFKKGIFSYPTHSISGPLTVMNTRAVSVTAYGTNDATAAGDPYFANSDFQNGIAFFRLANGAALRLVESRKMVPGRGLTDEDFAIFGTHASYSDFLYRWTTRPAEYTWDTPPCKIQEENIRETFAGKTELPPEVAEAYVRNILKVKDDDEVKSKVADFSIGGHGGSHPYLVNEFISAVRDGRRPFISIDMAQHWTAMAAAATVSALRDGEIVKIQV